MAIHAHLGGTFSVWYNGIFVGKIAKIGKVYHAKVDGKGQDFDSLYSAAWALAR